MTASAISNGWTRLRGIRAAVMLCALGLAGCTVDGPSPLASSLASPVTSRSFGPTVAFESVDGPPQQVFDRLLRALESESATGSFTIVSRETPASYRVRSYLSAQVSRRGGTTIAWVWDVYDRDQQRALRLSGEEPAGKTGRDAWAAADDQMMRRISQAGLRGLSALINGTLPAQDQPVPPSPTQPGGPAVASTGNDAAQGDSRTSGALAFNAH
ncbi:MAG: hypothetical protein K2X60_00175 [Xanthobacteraceae bacterium]|nr:hypothetical protein [Xanthobacteraceae bacterium]